MALVRVPKIPLIPVDSHQVISPGWACSIQFSSKEELGKFLDVTGIRDVPFCFFTMKDPRKSDDSSESFYPIGIVLEVTVDFDTLKIRHVGLYRAKVIRIAKTEDKKCDRVQLMQINDENCDSYFIEQKEEVETSLGTIVNLLQKFAGLYRDFYQNVESEEIASTLFYIARELNAVDCFDKDEVNRLIWGIVFHLPDIPVEQKQNFIESFHLPERIKLCMDVLNQRIEILEHSSKKTRPSQRLLAEGRSKNNFPKRQMTSGGSRGSSDEEFLMNVSDPRIKERFQKFVAMRDSIKDETIRNIFVEKSMADFHRIRSFADVAGNQTEMAMIYNHLDLFLSLPWATESPQQDDIKAFERDFEGDHFGLDQVKDEICDNIAARTLNPARKSKTLLFVGPPGVGKTSVCKSIAKGLGLKYTRISLGGLRDEAEIRGHRSTYIGAFQGQIMDGLKRAGTKNPVFVLDEVDKIKADFRGDPSSALLEVLDPEQNHSFRDNYLDAPFDLSKVLFICTANMFEGIPPALRDRMDPIIFSSYTEEEKVEIAKRFLLPKVLQEVGLAQKGFELKWENDDPGRVITKIVRGYIKEAGVRDLERKLHRIAAKIGREYLRDPVSAKRLVVNDELVEKFLDTPRYVKTRANLTRPGEIIGLAWTPYGGDILYVQSAILPEFKGKELSQTGSLGKVMQEAGKLALSLIRVQLEKEQQTKLLDHKSVHIHVPEGAIEKDGPSAGVTTFCSLYSALYQRAAKPYVAMTGEITLTGMVTGVGGIKEKVIAAKNAGVKEVILPSSNRRDLAGVPKSGKSGLKFHFIDNVDDALKIVFPDIQSA